MDFKKFLEMANDSIVEAKKKESTSKKDHKAEKAGKKVAKDIEYDEGHEGKDDNKAERAGKKVTKDIEYDDKKDKKKSLKDWFEIVEKNKLNETSTMGMKPVPVMDPKTNKPAGAAVVTSTSPELQNIFKNLDPKKVQVVMTAQASQPNRSQTGLTVGGGATTATEGAEDNPESAMMEKWAGDAEVKPTGQYKYKTKEELKSMLAKLHKSGPHDKDSPAAKKMRQINFALRAKGGWKSGEGAAMKEESMDESGLQAYLGNKKYGKEGMDALRKAGREGASKEKMAQIRAKHDKLDEVQVDEKAKNPYAIGMAQAMKSKGDKPPLKKSTITKAHDIAKSIKKKTDEAQIPNSGPDYGAGLGAGRSQETFEGRAKADNKAEKAGKKVTKDLEYDMNHKGKDDNKAEKAGKKVTKDIEYDEKKAAADKKKQKVKESMNTCEAAYHEGKSHGLTKHGYSCRYDEGTEEHRRYHEGFKEGLDECYGLMPNRGLVGETMPAATVPGMAQQAMEDSDLLDEVFFFPDTPPGPRTPDQQRARNLPKDTLSMRGGRNTPVGGPEGYKDMVRGTGAFGPTAKNIYGIKGPKGNLPEADLDEMNKTQYMQHKAKTTPGDTFKAFGQTFHDKDVLEDNFAFESLDRQLNALLDQDTTVVNEGISVNMSQGLGGPNGEDSVSVTAQGDDAAKLIAFIKQVGLGGLGSDKAEVTSMAEPAIAVVSDYGAPKFSGHDDMKSLLSKVTGDDYKDEEDHEHDHSASVCNECGMNETKCACDEEKVVDETQTPNQMTDSMAEDSAGADEVAMTTADEDAEAAEDQTKPAVGGAVTEGGDGMEDSSGAAQGVAAGADAEEAEAEMNEAEKLDEWANDAGKDGTEQSFERDIEFMTKVIAGGLNKPKATGQTTVPVIAGQNARIGDEDVTAWKRLAGILK